MKWLLCALIGLLLVTNVALLRRQVRVEARLEAVQADNQQLAQEVTNRPHFSLHEREQLQNQLQRADAMLQATEQRLTNATAMISALESAAARVSPAMSSRSGARVPRRIFTTPSGEGIPFEDPGFAPAPLIPSSSHTADGRLQTRSWGPEQVIGPPDTHTAGDISTAWAPRDSTGTGEEWLHVNYERSVDIAEINVRETHNPGAISKVAAVMPDGREFVVWEGTEPPGQPPLNTTFRVPSGVQAQSVKVYLDRTRVPGWNEIDAVELVSRDGTRQWASSATASSSYAER